MRKKLLSMLALLMVAVTGAWADGLSGEGTAGSPYLIQSDDDWTEFCTNFATYRTAVVKLTSNVTITTPLGTSDAPFTGTFDGNGHTMNANITDNSGSAAPFRYINGGTIRNLVVTGSVSGSTHTSGLVGFTDGDSNTQNTIENCLVQANVTCSAHFGGLVGHGLSSKVVITGCAFTGNMAIPNKNQYAGGLLGWCGNAIVEITNSIFAGTRSGNGTVKFHPIGIFYGSSSNVTGCSNCYYTIAGTTSEFVRYTGKQAFTITAGENVVSLAVVKGTASTYNVSGITVYENTPGMTYGDTYYVGNGDAVELALTTANNPDPDHYITNYLLTSGTFNKATSTLTMGNSNAVVSAEYFRPLEGAGTADSPYLIQSDDDWICFCHIFDTYGASVIKLTSNINVTTIAGSNAVPFTGTFDGDGYTMTVNINDNSATYTAPFRYIQGATIRNLVATGSVTSNKNHTAGLVGGVKAGASTIENCLVSVDVNCGVYCGGIVGHGQSSTLTMTGCAYTGTMATSGNYAGGLQGWADSNTLIMTNCIFAGTKTGNATFNPIAVNVGTATGSGNCYYTVAGNNSSNYNGKQAFTITAGEGVTSLAVVKGAASTYSVSGITVYEGTPGMTYGGTYYVGNGDEVQLDLTADESIASDPDLQYLSTSGTFDSSTSTLTMGNANAVLSAMVLHPLSGEGTTDSPYLIQSDDDWIRFCLNFDTYKASVIKLTNDINATTIAGTQANPFAGTFDGDGYTMTVSINDNSAQGTAPFRAIGGATISNLVVAGSVTSTQYHTAGLVGFIVSGTNTIVNCRVEATINCSTYCGGFVGNSGNNSTLNMTGCAFTGTLNTSGNYVGGMRGWGSCTLNMTNCIFAGTKTGNASFNPMALDGGNVSGCGNCYYLTAGNNTNCYAGKQAFTITAGENVTSLAIDGAATTYSVSGITVYAGTPGMSYGGNLYAGNGDAVKLALTTDKNPDPDRYITSYQSTSGNFSGTTLTMGNGNAVISATFFRPLDGAGTAESPYLIEEDAGWTEFCTHFDTYKASVIKLTNDINATTIAGTSDNPFTGTFDGDGHTLTFNCTATGEYCAPFAYINGATFNNLHVAGTITTSYRRTGGLIGQSFGTSSINNCRSSVEIISSYNGDAIRGGFAAALGEGTLNFNGCIFDGTFTGTSSQTWGGFVGWKYNYTVNIVNSLFAPNSVNVSASYSYTFSGNGGTVNNSYYFTNHGTAQGKQAFTITAGENVTSVTVVKGAATTYSVSGITVYEGTPGMSYDGTYYVGNGDAVELELTTDKNPDPDRYITSYQSTSGNFSGTTLTMGNGNAVISATFFRPLDGAGTAESPYLIEEDAGWTEFCTHFDTYKTSVIKLTSDINVTTIAGTYDSPFTGTFDGLGNTMTASINDNSASGTAPFRAIQGATIRNLVATGSVTSTQNHAGGLVGFVRTGASTIENCLVQTNVNCNTYCGGIVGHGQNSTLTMTGCAYTGTMATSGNTAGGLQGWADSNTLIMTNCIFAGTKTGGASFNPIAVNVGTATGSGNCYYTVAGNKSSNYNGKQGFTITAGEDVTSLSIDGTATTYSVSGITVYEDMPGMKFDDTYYAGNGDAVKLALTIDESIASDPELEYLSTSGTFDSSTSTLTMGNANAVVSAMVLKALSGEGTALSPYLIQKSSDWLWFCQNFDTYKASVIKLTNNINVTTIAGTRNNPFTGTFDGDGNTMNVSINDNSAKGTAPFRAISRATISNLVVAGSVTSNQYYTAGLVGFIVDGTNTIVNCRVEATINCGTYCGGFVGNGLLTSTLNMTGCAFTGTLNTSGDNVGGMRGEGGCPLNMTNCIFAGTKTGNASFSPMALNGGNVSGCGNCYYLTAGNNTTGYTGKQAFTITAGENVTALAIDGAATTYSVSGITVYEDMPGMKFGDVLYAGNDDVVKLAFTIDNLDPEHYKVNYLPTSGTFDSSTSTLTMGNAAVTLNVQLIAFYNVTYNANSGTGAPDAQEKLENIDLVLSSTVPTRDGYAFIGWNTAADGSGDSYAAGATYTANAGATLYAQWAEIFTVTYDGNSGSGAPDAQEKVENVDLVLSSTVPTRDGYAFTGWNTAVDGSGDSYAAGDTYTANASVTLYAQWAVTYAVTYNANGGTGAPDAQLKVDGIDLVLTNTVPTRTGYAFTGWNTKYNGNGDSYAPGATYTTNAALNLYAQWVPIYIVSVKSGTEDAVNWTITPNSAWAGQTVTATYSGKKKVKSVKAKNKPKGNGSLQDYNVTTINE